ncbi:neutral zinc metallopeptidase [bacterium]|nr:neutral zinc metallopeptidase [bacterium]
MLWKNRRQSTNVEDRRGSGGGMRGMPGPGVAIGGGGAVIILILALLFGVDPQELLQQSGTPGGSGGYSQGVEQQQPAGEYVGDPHEEELKQFVGVVLADTEDIWGRIFAEQGLTYTPPTLVVFSGQVESACGYASAAVGPFYCPADQNVYIDLSFLDELRTRFGAPGDFAGAYVVAHEVGHHVQNLMGTAQQVNSMRSRLSEKEFNELSVRQELQADFYAGIWAHYAEHSLGVLEPGDIEEALKAANQIGDDNLQMQAQGYVVPDAFTHGTSEQRARWFRKGYESGDISQGDTFSARDL